VQHSVSDNCTCNLLEPMTAGEFLERYEPGVIDLMLDPETALAEDTAKAATIAEKPAADGRYPRAVWEAAYPA
jgi:hypothetical protein